MSRKLTFIGIPLSALLIGLLYQVAFGASDVWFVNGLDVPVSVAVDGAAFTVAPQQHLQRRLRVGLRGVEVRSGGAVLRREEVWVPASTDAVVYNVLGAAPVYAIDHVYSANPSGSREPTIQHYAGTSFVARDHIDYVFTEAPHSISVDEHSSSVIKWQLTAAPGGWTTSANVLMGQGRDREAARLARAVLELEPRNTVALYVALRALELSDGQEAALAFAREAVEQQPEWIEGHKGYQHLLRRTGRLNEGRRYYQAALDKQPDSVAAAYLLSRLEEPEAAIARLKALSAARPEEPLFHRALAFTLFRAGAYEESLKHYEALAARDPEYGSYYDWHAQALAALGRNREALKVAAEHGDKAEKLDWRFVVLYARLAARVSASELPHPVSDYLKRVSDRDSEDEMRVWIAAQLGEDIEERKLRELGDSSTGQAVRILLALRKGPAEAWWACAKARKQGLTALEDGTALLLGAEFERAGDPVQADRLFETLESVPVSRERLKAAARGELPAESLTELEPAERAALALVQARRLDALGEDSAAAYAAAERLDLLHGAVTVAMRNWERPKPGSGTASRGRVLRRVEAARETGAVSRESAP